MDVFEQFCNNLKDHSNWHFGEMTNFEGRTKFYGKDPSFRVLINFDVDKSRGDNGRVKPEQLADIFRVNPDSFDATESKFYKVGLFHNDLLIKDLVSISLDNNRINVVHPDRAC